MNDINKKHTSSKDNLFSLSERLLHGVLRPQEVWSLAGKGKTSFYEDVKAGKVVLRKIGRRSSGVYGPDAKRYIQSSLGLMGE
jgi:hypothetical protein